MSEHLTRFFQTLMFGVIIELEEEGVAKAGEIAIVGMPTGLTVAPESLFGGGLD